MPRRMREAARVGIEPMGESGKAGGLCAKTRPFADESRV
jgi:hypothetical protein